MPSDENIIGETKESTKTIVTLGNGSLPKFGGRTNGLFFSTKNSSPLGFFFKVNASFVWHAFEENKNY